MDEVIIAQSYTERDTDKVMPDPHFDGRFVPVVTAGEVDHKLPVTQTMMETLGHQRWRLALLMYEQEEQYENVVPYVAMFYGWDGGVQSDSLGLVHDRFGEIKYRRIREDATRRVRTIREMMLNDLTREPKFGVVVSYRFPAHPWRTQGKVHWYSAFNPKLYNVQSFLYRAIVDLPSHFLRSSDPKMANAAALAEMIL